MIVVGVTLTALLFLSLLASWLKSQHRKQTLARVAAFRQGERDGLLLKEHFKEQRKIGQGKRVFRAPEGMVWNPLRSYPRNAPCVCGSGKKFKGCHLQELPDTCSASDAKNLQGLVDRAKCGENVPSLVLKAQART